MARPIDPDLFADDDAFGADDADTWSLDELDGCADVDSIRSAWANADDRDD